MKADLIKAIRNAIAKEDDAYRLYQKLAADAKGYNLQNLFNALAIEELKHEALLKECLRNGDIKAAMQRITERYDEFNLAGRLNHAAELSGVQDGIELAMRLEAEACKDYLDLERSVEDPEQQEVFTFLASQEKSHLAVLKREYGRL